MVVLAALLLYAVMAAAVVFGAWLVLHDFPSLAIIPGVLLLAVGVALRPRFGRLNPRATTLSRQEAPTLFGLIDKVAAAVGAPSPHVIIVERSFNAYAGTVGLRRRRVLALGLGLWSALPPQQRVALLGHELGHFVNGDPGRGLLTQPAFTALAQLAELTRPIPGSVARASGLAEWIGSAIAYAVMSVLYGALRAGQLALWVVAFRDTQRAEYLADDLAAKAGGSDAATALADTLVRLDAIEFAVRRAARSGGTADEWRQAADAARREGQSELPVLRGNCRCATRPRCSPPTRRPACGPGWWGHGRHAPPRWCSARRTRGASTPNSPNTTRRHAATWTP